MAQLIKLTSYERMRLAFRNKGVDDALTDGVSARSQILRHIASVSKKIENYLGREIGIESRTEYFDVRAGNNRYFVSSSPISSITSVKLDNEGKFDGGETTFGSDEYCIGVDANNVVLDYKADFEADRALEIVYTGGLVASGVQTIFTVAGASGAFTAGKYLTGADSMSLGNVKAWDSENSRLTVEILYGVFDTSEIVTQHDSEADAFSGTSPSTTATIASRYQESAAEKYPDLCMACEMQVRYDYSHFLDFESTGVDKNGMQMRTKAYVPNSNRPVEFTPEVLALLNPYRRVIV